MDKIDELKENLMDLVDEMLEDSYVVTNGYDVGAVMSRRDAASYLAKRMRKDSGDDCWGAFPIPIAIKIAFEKGRVIGLMESRNGQDTKLREGDVQSEEEVS